MINYANYVLPFVRFKIDLQGQDIAAVKASISVYVAVFVEVGFTLYVSAPRKFINQIIETLKKYKIDIKVNSKDLIL
jgi:hypothetical protein